MNKGWYLVLILGFLLVTIWLGKWMSLQSQMDFIVLALGLILLQVLKSKEKDKFLLTSVF